jgi:hypothetical protein
MWEPSTSRSSPEGRRAGKESQMNRRAVAALWLALGTSILGTRPARGADTDAEKEARLLFQQGLQRFDLHDYDGARVAFQQAYRLAPRWNLLRNIAACEWKLGQPLEALHHLQMALRDPRSRSQRSDAQQAFELAYAATGHVAVAADDGASILVDGTPADGTAPLKDPVDVLAGHHELVARLGDQTQHAQVDAKAGIVVSVDLHFPVSTPPSLPPAASASSASPASPASPASAPSPPAIVPALPEPDRTMTGTPSWWNDGRNVVGVVVAGAAVTTLVTGLGFDLDGKSKGSSAANALASDPSPCIDRSSSSCTSYSSLLDAEQRDFVASRTLYIAGGVLALTATVLLWPHHRNATTTTLWIAPSAGKRSAGLGLGASF